jgi:hypothetical protein
VETVKNALLAVIVLGVLVYLGGGLAAAGIFLLFVAFFLLPAVVIAARAPLVRSMLAELRITAASVIVVILAVPWYFARKAIGMPVITDVVASIALTFTALRFGSPRQLVEELRVRLAVPVLAVLSLIFALVWLGFDVRVGSDVRYYGLLAVDFGNLASAVSTIRLSPMLPLSYIDGGGSFSYHWLYFSLPAMLSDFLGATIPSANALILTNLLMAALLFHTIVAAARWFGAEGK